jgi:hypothetical protein
MIFHNQPSPVTITYATQKQEVARTRFVHRQRGATLLAAQPTSLVCDSHGLPLQM